MKEEEKNKLKEPEAIYFKKKRITFSTIETQGDIQLQQALLLTHEERLQDMLQLNNYAYQLKGNEKIDFRNSRLKFYRYEYIPS
ncbi:MAG: hypothetical protein H7Y00_05335 [Fimbriimonadaceae bacterium]|nr:hypothetical protein [Chitinophagales bacterium]